MTTTLTDFKCKTRWLLDHTHLWASRRVSKYNISCDCVCIFDSRLYFPWNIIVVKCYCLNFHNFFFVSSSTVVLAIKHWGMKWEKLFTCNSVECSIPYSRSEYGKWREVIKMTRVGNDILLAAYASHFIGLQSTRLWCRQQCFYIVCVCVLCIFLIENHHHHTSSEQTFHHYHISSLVIFNMYTLFT